jgi:XTP/dITP diphosphohydrolase
MQNKIVFATSNNHKLLEVQSMLGDQFKLLSLKDFNFNEEIPENQTTLEGNAVEKARYIYNRFLEPCFADDTGLEVEALNGEPGIYSARYAGSILNYGTEEKRSAANISKLLAKLSGNTNRKARFRTVIAYTNGTSDHLFEGVVQGSIIDVRRGFEGFGYDPIFVPNGYTDTFAEMPLTEKNSISHRARAFTKFIDFLQNER